MFREKYTYIMDKDISQKVEQYINQVLSDSTIWASSTRFEESVRNLEKELFLSGCGKEDIIKASCELIQRREVLYVEYPKNSFYVEDGEEVDLDEWLQETNQH